MKAVKMKTTTAKAHDLDSIRRIDLFRDLTEPQLIQLSQVLHGKIYPAGTTLITVEQPGEAVYFIVSGTVKVHVSQEDGRAT